MIYDENGVQVRTIPAIHADQSVSFILEWNGLSFAYSSDTVPNIWWAEHTKGVDLSIHECFPLDLATDFMVWNVTKDAIRTRMAVVNEESFAAPGRATENSRSLVRISRLDGGDAPVLRTGWVN